jgi:ATP-dependent DNA helicase RecG
MAVTLQPLQAMSVMTLKGVGKAIADKLAKLHIFTIQDLLFHLPNRYQDRTRVIALRDLRQGDYALIEGTIVNSQIKFGKKRQLVVTLQDGNSFIELRFFHFNKSQQQQLAVDTKLRCFGEVNFWQGKCVMVHPEYSHAGNQNNNDVDQHLTPIYPSTEGLHQAMWRKLTDQALMYLKAEGFVEDVLPDAILQQQNFFSLRDALLYIHRPPPDADQALLLEGLHPSQQRLAFEELLTYQLSIQQLRQQVQQHKAPKLTEQNLVCTFLKNLPFELTQAQQHVMQHVNDDLQKSVPMMRLVQGDVGSGKTVIAAIAALLAVSSGYQAVIMAPTEILAEQHYQNFISWFEPLGVKVDYLVGSLTTKQKRSIHENIALGMSQVVVGTHALFQNAVEFKQLGLLVIDEQHRFGVHQRLMLREKGFLADSYPHQLIMTATPIPRTLAMTTYADLDISIIDELPPGRSPVNTVVVSEAKRQQVLQKAQQQVLQGEQVYWVCPLIEESETLQCQAAEKLYEQLQKDLTELNIGLIHGRMRPQEKEQVMRQFSQGTLHVLVATTVIEVGVNVPNATLMIIENAERLGLAQLHQLRGRVGRGAKQSFCILSYKSPLSDIARQRLTIMRETTDGFKIAEQDLKIRGFGEMLGTRQTGVQQFRIADLWRDQKLLEVMPEVVTKMINQHPELVKKLLTRWIGERRFYVHA